MTDDLKKPNWAEVITAIATGVAALSTIVAAVAAILIPFAIEDAAKTTRTAQTVNEVTRVIDDLVDKKIQQDRLNNKDTQGKEAKSSDYINDPTNKVRGFVFRTLNEYDYICSGVNLGIFREDVIKKIRGDALSNTWQEYAEFIADRRKLPSGKNAWNECDSVINRINKQ